MGAWRGVLRHRPALGVVVLAVLVGATGLVLWLNRDAGDPYSTARLSQDVRVRCAQTGHEWTITRGLMEMELRAIPGQLDPDQGLASPYADGARVAFPVDRADWAETIARINREKAQLSRASAMRTGGGDPDR